MKQLLFAAALTLATTFSFANPTNNTNGETKTSFRRDFKNAQLMSTEEHTNFTKLTFTTNGLIMSAFYSPTGELMAVTRNIVSSQLPVNLLTNLKKYYSTTWITDLFELSSENQDCYYITLENADSKVTLRSNGDSWEFYTTSKK
ncbi:MAG TPA: hypothetical protein VK518_06325 [Puia sp.]|nr:hypothetical protein [Puia sp.]